MNSPIDRAGKAGERPRLFDGRRWPNLVRHQPPGHFGGHTGISPFSPGEISRRQAQVQARLKELDCDLLIAQGYFPPATMGCHPTLYWLSGYNGYRNTMTLILPQKGELIEVPGVKYSSNPGWEEPYSAVEDMSPYLKGAKRIAYDGTGFITHKFWEYLMETCPGAELVEFRNELGHMQSIKSPEERAAVRDAICLQDQIFASAPLFLQPGRTCQEVTADITAALWKLGADASLMGKVLIDLVPNRPLRAEDAGGHVAQPDRRIRMDDCVSLMLEGPGSGGYYAQRGRCFCFSEPHEELRQAFALAKGLYEYTWPLLTPGRTKEELLELTNQYRRTHGIAPLVRSQAALKEDRISGLACAGVVRGLGMLTVDRPQDQFAWEDLDISIGHTVVVGGFAAYGSHSAGIAETCIVEDSGPVIPGRFPLEITVL